ncbi:MAG TPA: DUF2071 domain-containing protein [Bryobacteraceae bacterium]|nr:DUF2071 domain-containing protein [Bryobacteraceae bacterium]
MELASIHWSYPPAALAKLIPDGLELDLYDGKAWLGILPFEVTNFHFLGLPQLPWISTFLETNLRTYVRARDGSTGVWFFSLDADRLFDVIGARLVFRLPYMWSAMRCERNGSEILYHHTRTWPGRPAAHSRVRVAIGEAIPPASVSDLEIFLSARWRLYSLIGGKLCYAQVEHEVWPFHRAQILEIDQNLVTAAGVPPPKGEALVLYSPGVTAKVTLAKPVPNAARAAG